MTKAELQAVIVASLMIISLSRETSKTHVNRQSVHMHCSEYEDAQREPGPSARIRLICNNLERGARGKEVAMKNIGTHELVRPSTMVRCKTRAIATNKVVLASLEPRAVRTVPPLPLDT